MMLREEVESLEMELASRPAVKAVRELNHLAKSSGKIHKMIAKDQDALRTFGLSTVSTVGRAIPRQTKKRAQKQAEQHRLDSMPRKEVRLKLPMGIASYTKDFKVSEDSKKRGLMTPRGSNRNPHAA